MEWITKVKTTTKWEKSAKQASTLRLQGNTKYKQGNNVASLALYTESVTHAPKGSEELSLALGNRSAVLYHMQSYQVIINY